MAEHTWAEHYKLAKDLPRLHVCATPKSLGGGGGEHSFKGVCYF